MCSLCLSFVWCRWHWIQFPTFQGLRYFCHQRFIRVCVSVFFHTFHMISSFEYFNSLVLFQLASHQMSAAHSYFLKVLNVFHSFIQCIKNVLWFRKKCYVFGLYCVSMHTNAVESIRSSLVTNREKVLCTLSPLIVNAMWMGLFRFFLYVAVGREWIDAAHVALIMRFIFLHLAYAIAITTACNTNCDVHKWNIY